MKMKKKDLEKLDKLIEQGNNILKDMIENTEEPNVLFVEILVLQTKLYALRAMVDEVDENEA